MRTVWHACGWMAACCPGLTSILALGRAALSLEELHILVVNNSIEYIRLSVPSGEQGLWPSRLWVSSEGGDAVRPLLLTARQKSGATTWQLPYESGNQLHHEFQRTLCPDDTAEGGSADCAGEEAERASGEFSLHVGTSCAAQVHVQLRVDPARDWRLSDQWATHVIATQRAPSVHHYRFVEGQDSVRLMITSDDDFCATLSVQNYTCPIVQTLEGFQTDTLRMTVQRSGGVQLSRTRFPRGFYVVTIVHATDEACSGVPQPDDDWLWEAAVWAAGGAGGARPAAPPRLKRLRYEIKASLSVQQYVVAVVVTTVVFVGFYVAFGLLVVLRRWPSWNALVAPKAVLAQPQGAEAEAGVVSEGDSTIVADTPARPRRRRDSNATFDSSDNSDTDSEEEQRAGAAPPSPGMGTPSPAATRSTLASPHSPSAEVNGQLPADEGQAAANNTEQDAQAPRPFGLPARLHVAALARRHGRVLRARSDRYLYTLYTVAIFYALPVIQFVAAFQIVLNLSGSLDLCYYNFLCAHPAGAVSDFNHVFSNIGYLLLGALFMLQLRRRSARRKRKPRDEEYGIPAHYGLLASLGAGMMVVALLSASYHICPNRLNFQFDTAFMYVLAVLLMVKIYQARHPDINARAHATFGVLALLIALVCFTILNSLRFGLLPFRHFTCTVVAQCLAVAARELAARRPLYTPRLVMLLIANAVNWAFALYGLFTQTGDIASHLLSVLLCNTLLYIVFYLTMKLLHGERPRWYAWCYLAAAAAAWAPALYFFTSGSTSWAATAAQSRHLNHECLLLHFYDAHDLWHVLSAVALYFTFNVMLTWDDGLAAVKRTDIAVF
ncbi:hypothetical protein K1T71_008535 [Dendrolimus kikuchii]|uniref:Uncharacterized protein n=1 Tax=Dendrolimus kikuchii TaxID=765133 RepID=A0ACC1CUX6_9NEOP|nr:hypothetical protein K1T71_008535 [Dendrolimus kikuchii]